MDVDLFNEQMNGLLAGETVDMPVFDFVKGSKRYGTRITRAEEDQPIVIEGIHALNDKLTEDIPEEEKYRIYISPLTTLNIDDNNRIPGERSASRAQNRPGYPFQRKDRQSDAERMGESTGRRSKKYFSVQRRGGCLF